MIEITTDDLNDCGEFEIEFSLGNRTMLIFGAAHTYQTAESCGQGWDRHEWTETHIESIEIDQITWANEIEDIHPEVERGLIKLIQRETNKYL